MSFSRTIRSALLCLAAAPVLVLAGTPGGPGVHLRVGLYQNPPKIFLDAAGQPAGIFIDVLRAVANQEDWTLEYVPGSWAEGLDRVATGEIDLMPDVAFTSEREELYDFHREPVLSDWFQVYARRGSGIRSILDLDGRRVAVVEHSLQQESLAKLAGGLGLKPKLVAEPDYTAAFSAVARGQADAVVASRFSGTLAARDPRIEDTAIIFNPTRIFFAARHGLAPDVLKAIDRHLKEMKTDSSSVYYDSLRRWTTEPVGFRIPRPVVWAGIALAVLLLLVLLWNLALNRQVSRRAAELAAQNEENRLLYDRARASEERVRLHALLLGSVRESVVASDLEGRIIYWSRGAEQMYGYSAVEVMGKPYRDFAGAIDPPDEEDFRQQLKASGTWHGEHLQKNRKGETFWTETYLALVTDEQGRHAGYIGIDRDITERKRAATEQLACQSRFAALFDANPAGLMLVDQATFKIVQVNAAAIAMIGLPAGSIVGRACHGFICPTEEGHCPVCDLKQTVDRSERVLVRADGRLLPILKTVVPITLDNRNFLLESFIDISEYKRVLSERTQLQRQLVQAEKMESVGRLAGGVAHDFNNMLGAILSYIELILEDTPKDGRHFADLCEIRKIIERSSDLVRQLLAFARQQPVAPRPVELNTVAEDLLRMLRRLIGENVQLEWRPHPEAGALVVDPVQIDQILVNLCVNSRDAISGAGQILIETGAARFGPEAPPPAHSDLPPGEYVTLSVSDTGRGMDADTLTKLFEPFFTTKGPGQGTGLGLAIVYGIVKQNGGHIEAASTPGQGSTFRIYLPRTRPPQAAPA